MSTIGVIGGSTITNEQGATISGGTNGIDRAEGTVTNAGTITGGTNGIASQCRERDECPRGHDQRWQFRYQRARHGDATRARSRAELHRWRFSGTGPNTLTLQTGSVLNGDAMGSTSTGATNNLILQGNGTANNNFVGFQSLDVQANSIWVLNGNSSVGAAATQRRTLEVGDANACRCESHRRRDGKFRRRCWQVKALSPATSMS